MTNISDKRDDPVEIAHQLYQKHGYQQALHTCIRHINSSDNYIERFKWGKHCQRTNVPQPE